MDRPSIRLDTPGRITVTVLSIDGVDEQTPARPLLVAPTLWAGCQPIYFAAAALMS